MQYGVGLRDAEAQRVLEETFLRARVLGDITEPLICAIYLQATAGEAGPASQRYRDVQCSMPAVVLKEREREGGRDLKEFVEASHPPDADSPPLSLSVARCLSLSLTHTPSQGSSLSLTLAHTLSEGGTWRSLSKPATRRTLTPPLSLCFARCLSLSHTHTLSGVISLSHTHSL